MTTEIKLYLGLGLVVIVGSLFLLFAHHERNVEHSADVAVDAKAVAVQAKKDDAIVETDAGIVKDEAKTYAIDTSIPVTHAPVISVCVQPRDTVHVAAKAGDRSKPDGAADVRATDPQLPPLIVKWSSEPVVRAGRDADAQIKQLQDYIIRVCPTL